MCQHRHRSKKSWRSTSSRVRCCCRTKIDSCIVRTRRKADEFGTIDMSHRTIELVRNKHVAFNEILFVRSLTSTIDNATATSGTTATTSSSSSSSSSTTTVNASSSSSSSSDPVMYYIYLAFTNCLHLLRPQRAPAFAFAWLEIVAHRTFLSRFLHTGGRFARQIHNMYALLLVDALRLVAPFIRSGENTPSFQAYYKGILKTFMLLLHDFPEFLCEHYYEFCDCLPLISHQLRNVILSSFPKHIRCPDPFKVNIKIDMLNDISIPPTISFHYSMNIQPGKFKFNLDSYLRTRSPVTFLSELRSYLQHGSDPGSHYNIRMLNALVLYVATQALATLNNKQPLMSSITHTAHMDIFQNLAVDLDTEGRYLFLNAMANHLRYPNTHTHYFSYTILYLFAEANSEALQEQIVR
jgi:CCR4-NOT transcription complex subunit 1